MSGKGPAIKAALITFCLRTARERGWTISSVLEIFFHERKAASEWKRDGGGAGWGTEGNFSPDV